MLIHTKVSDYYLNSNRVESQGDLFLLSSMCSWYCKKKKKESVTYESRTHRGPRREKLSQIREKDNISFVCCVPHLLGELQDLLWICGSRFHFMLRYTWSAEVPALNIDNSSMLIRWRPSTSSQVSFLNDPRFPVHFATGFVSLLNLWQLTCPRVAAALLISEKLLSALQ